jgi:hypothetical protein
MTLQLIDVNVHFFYIVMFKDVLKYIESRTSFNNLLCFIFSHNTISKIIFSNVVCMKLLTLADISFS